MIAVSSRISSISGGSTNQFGDSSSKSPESLVNLQDDSGSCHLPPAEATEPAEPEYPGGGVNVAKIWQWDGSRRGFGDPRLPPRFWAKVAPPESTEACWEWIGARKKSGYGNFWVTPGVTCGIAHRVAYKALVGPILRACEVDHLCRNPPCVNPAHLEVVTRRINTQRAADHRRVEREAVGDFGSSVGPAWPTKCVEGHEMGPWNPRRIQPNCDACDVETEAEIDASRAAFFAEIRARPKKKPHKANDRPMGVPIAPSPIARVR